MGTTISLDPFIANLRAKLPPETRDTFTDEQLIRLKAALGGAYSREGRNASRAWRLRPRWQSS